MFKKLIIISIFLNIIFLPALAKEKGKTIRLIKKTTQQKINRTIQEPKTAKKVNVKSKIKNPQIVEKVKVDNPKNTRIQALMIELKYLQDLLLKTPASSQTAALGLIAGTATTSLISQPMPLADTPEEIPSDFILDQRSKLFLTSFEGRGSKGYDTGFWEINYPYWSLNWTFADLSNQGRGGGGIITFKVYRKDKADEILIGTITSSGDGHRYLKGNGLYRVKVESSDFSGWSVDMRTVRDK